MENVDLFGNKMLPPPKTPSNMIGQRMHDQLIKIHGSVNDKCKNCKFLKRHRQGQAWFKCALAEPVVKSGPSGDWRVNYQACGKFENDES